MRASIFSAIAVALIASAFGITSAKAEGPRLRDLSIVQACLAKRQTTAEQERCIEVVAKPCIGDEGARAPFDVMACLRREQLVWDQMLNAAYGKLQKNLEDGQRNKLREMQRSWLDTREKTCAFYYDYFQGSMANPMMANCENREIARRAIFLLGFADDLPKDDKGK
jgi:uncharacterized protein YecT (DUF1311 family)